MPEKKFRKVQVHDVALGLTPFLPAKSAADHWALVTLPCVGTAGGSSKSAMFGFLVLLS